MEQELQKYNLPELITSNLRDEDRKMAIWEVIYDYAEKNVYYLTNEEKNDFLAALERGANYVDIGGYILSNKFLVISLCEDKYRKLEDPTLLKDNSVNYPEMKELTPEQLEENKSRMKTLRSDLFKKGVIKNE